jgi:agmatinase
MTGVATFAVPPSFLGIARNDPAAPICIAGIPFDLGTTNRAGARFGSAAIRQASRMLIDGDHPVHWVNPAALPLADIGNFAIALGDIAKSLALIEEQAARIAHLVALGGDHGITLPLLRALAKKRGPVALVHFDAHVDTWPDNFGQTQAHGTVFYHAIKEGLVKPHQMVQIGIRSPLERAVHDWTLAQGITVVPAQKVHEQGRPRPPSKPRHRRRRPGLSELRYRRVRSALRSAPARRKSAGSRPGRRRRSCGGLPACNSSAWTWSSSARLTMSPKPPRSPAPPWPGNISVCSPRNRMRVSRTRLI